MCIFLFDNQLKLVIFVGPSEKIMAKSTPWLVGPAPPWFPMVGWKIARCSADASTIRSPAWCRGAMVDLGSGRGARNDAAKRSTTIYSIMDCHGIIMESSSNHHGLSWIIMTYHDISWSWDQDLSMFIPFHDEKIAAMDRNGTSLLPEVSDTPWDWVPLFTAAEAASHTPSKLRWM